MFINRNDLLLDNPAQFNYGAAVTDLDGDGQFEIFVAGFGCRSQALKWNGAAYLDVAGALLADPDRQSIGVGAADIDGDGREELYVLNSDTFAGGKRFADRLFAWNGVEWTDLFSLRHNQKTLNLTAGRSVACVDRNGDGRYGFFVANYGGPMRLYELDDDGWLCDVAPQAGVDFVTGGRALLSLPLVSPHSMDVFAGNENGPNFLFRSQGDGTFEDIAARLGIDDPLQNARGVTVLDANGDGLFDLVIGNWEGRHRLYLQRPYGPWQDVAPAAMARIARVRTVIAADFDNDGYEELFFNNIGEANRLFGQRDGEWVTLDIGDARESYGLGTGAVVGDFDSDGQLELLISHGESGAQPLSFYTTPSSGYHWLRVRPLTVYGAPARGAVVRLTAGGRRQMRAIDAGSGYLCQMEPVAHFGLGVLDAVERVEIVWPGGVEAVINHPAIDREIVVGCPV